MLFELDKLNSSYKKNKKVTFNDIGWTEKDLENLVSKNIKDFLFLNDLFVIFTERAMQEEPDIMALDENGDLYIFELKRWISNQENILQVLRYGQIYGNNNYAQLNELYLKKNYIKMITNHQNLKKIIKHILIYQKI